MGFLHKLWDETLAGPAPDTGLGKLRKYNSFSARLSPPMMSSNDNINDHHDQGITITRSIAILRRMDYPSFKNITVDPGSTPDSPATTPRTPVTTGTPNGDDRRFTRRKLPAEAVEHAEPRTPTVYDWFSLFFV